MACHPERKRRTSPTKLGSRWRLRVLDCACVRSLAPLEMTILVIYPVHLPGSPCHAVGLRRWVSFMNANQITAFQLHIPFSARPGFFVPPISGKQIGAALLDDLSVQICTSNMSWHIFIQQ